MFLLLVLALMPNSWGYESKYLKTNNDQLLKNEVLKITPQANHHFNIEAPQECDKSRPVTLTPRQIECQFTVAGKKSLLISVCDDKKTFCKQDTFEVVVSKNSSLDPLKKIIPKESEGLKNKIKSTFLDGFHEGSFKELKAQALQSGQPILILVSTDWCPSCNQLKEFVFSHNEFKNLLLDHYKIYVDGDSIVSAAWKSEIKYTYFPSLIYMNSNFEEVGRYPPDQFVWTEFRDWVQTMKTLESDPIKNVIMRVDKKKPSADDEVRLANYFLDKGQYPEVISRFKNNSALKYYVTLAQMNQATESSEKAKLALAALKVAPPQERLADVFFTACTGNKNCGPVVPAVVKYYTERLRLIDPVDDAFESAFLKMTLGDIYATIENTKLAKKYYGECASELKPVTATNLKLGTARGSAMALIYCLSETEDYKDALTWAAKIGDQFPYEPAYNLRLSNLYLKSKDYLKALDYANRAEKYSYGYNWPFAVQQKAKVLIGMGKKIEALALLNKTIDNLVLPADKSDRQHMLLANLKKYRNQIR